MYALMGKLVRTYHECKKSFIDKLYERPHTMQTLSFDFKELLAFTVLDESSQSSFYVGLKRSN